MTIVRKALGAALPILAVVGCQSTPADEDLWANPATGMLIARDRCSTCHQTGRTRELPAARAPALAGRDPTAPDVPAPPSDDSPNPNAPPFVDIANRPGMTEEGIAAWLRDGHNYPVEMGFYLDSHKVDALAAYIIRLRAGDGAR